MPIQTRKNQYQGVNAHLHSVFQNTPFGWEGFHSTHITHLAETLDRALPPYYLASTDQSFQIRTYDPDSGEPITSRKLRQSKPDISILGRGSGKNRDLSSLTSTVPTMTLSAADMMDDDIRLYLRSITIRTLGENNEIGQIVAWIELLSPTNKPPRSGFLQYRQKRNNVLRAGVVFVEMDYLHESEPVVGFLPSYPDKEIEAYPYTILVTDPRPNLQEGKTSVYGFHVDETMPTITIPLLDGDEITLNTGAVYNQTFESLRTFSNQVDYEQEPPRFDSYMPDDQARIRARMAAVAEQQPE